MNALEEIGLVQISGIEEKYTCIKTKFATLKKMIRSHHELDVNIEGIDIVFNLLQ